jgi:mono/diheme cytochrome c family protein
MQTTFTTIIALVLSFGLSASLPADDASTSLLSAFKAHCIKCHGKGGKIEGKINLLSLKSGDDFQSRPKLVEELITVLKDRQMPPEDEPLIPSVKREQMVTQLQAMLRQALERWATYL